MTNIFQTSLKVAVTRYLLRAIPFERGDLFENIMLEVTVLMNTI